jgi:hypothetical protein
MSMLRINTIDFGGIISVLNVQPSQAAPWTLKVFGDGFSGDEFLGADLFAALVALRLRLEEQGKRLLCAGARRDVCVSGMSRSMGGGRKGYVIRDGQPATETIDIFDQADERLIGTVDEQRLYKAHWASSLRERLGA